MKNLKTIIITLIMSSLTLTSFGQMDIVNFYNNPNEYLIYSIIAEFDSVSQETLNTKIKNWGGTAFVNMKEVLVTETKELLVFNYITKSFFVKMLGSEHYCAWYFRMVIQIKDNKIKISIYDDGNAFWAGTNEIPPTAPRTYKFTGYFKDGISKKMYTDGLYAVRTDCINTANNLISYIKNDTNNKVNNDW